VAVSFTIFLDRTRRWPPFRPTIIVTCDGSHGFMPHSETFSPDDNDPRSAAIEAGWHFLENGEVYCTQCARHM
jgi:hypothetical protein